MANVYRSKVILFESYRRQTQTDTHWGPVAQPDHQNDR